MPQIIPWWQIQYPPDAFPPDIPASSSPPPSTVNMWTGEAPGGGWNQPVRYGSPSPTPYPTPFPYTPPLASDIPGSPELNDIPTPEGPGPIVQTPTDPRAPDVSLVPPPNLPFVPSDWSNPLPGGDLPWWAATIPGVNQYLTGRNIVGAGIKAGQAIYNTAGRIRQGLGNVIPNLHTPNFASGGGYYDPSYLRSIGYEPGQGTGSLWPGGGPTGGAFDVGGYGVGGAGGSFFHDLAGGRGGPLPGATFGLGSFGGDVSGLLGMQTYHEAMPQFGGMTLAQVSRVHPDWLPGLANMRGAPPGSGPQPGGGGKVLPSPV